ncbi:MAG: very short patch repair endonuclease [Sulfuricaulis sp.]
MADIVNRKTRSRMMSGIKGKNTAPELQVRKALFAKDIRYRLHDKRLPGKPDLVIRKYHAVIFVHGCFWHRHHCHLFKWPVTRRKFWREKIKSNSVRDARVKKQLLANDWRVLTIWECSLKGRGRYTIKEIAHRTAQWLRGTRKRVEISGKTRYRARSK